MKFHCQIPEWDGEDDWREQEGYDASEAAEKYVERSEIEGAEYDVASGRRSVTVLVKERIDDATMDRFIVSGECAPVYTARKESRP
jgi:hypothetical protein